MAQNIVQLCHGRCSACTSEKEHSLLLSDMFSKCQLGQIG